MIKVVDFELVKEIRKIDRKLLMVSLVLGVLLFDDIITQKKIKKLESELEAKEKPKEE